MHTSQIPLLLETIRCENGIIHNLEYHQRRVDKSRRELFGLEDQLELSSLIKAPNEGLYRCRMLYDKNVRSIEYLSYTPKTFHTLKIIQATIGYSYKFADRNILEALLKSHPEADDVIIEHNGLITDTTIANIALFDGERWVTPKSPLLEGIMRARLIDEGFLHTADIPSNEIEKYEKVALMNAMIGFRIINPKIIATIT